MGRIESCRVSRQKICGLYAITPDETDTAELLRKVRLALLGGARLLQYRNKIADVALRLEQAWALRELTHEFSVPQSRMPAYNPNRDKSPASAPSYRC